MDSKRLRVVASGDYRHTQGADTLEALGFSAYARLAHRIDLTMLPAGPQTASVSGAELQGADALLMLGQYLRDDAIAASSRELLVIARAGVGVDKIDVESCTRHGVLLFNVPDALTEGTAAGALALMFAASRRMIMLDRVTREGRWDDRQFHRGTEIYGKTLGVIGPGRIGSELIRICAPFRMRNLVYSPRMTAARAARLGAEAASLDQVMRESDFVVLCCPLTEETRGMIAARDIAAMKREAFLINVARGPVIDQDALVQALRERRIAGAGLDVFTTQPVPKDDPLTQLDNVTLAPHAICDTYELRRDVLAETAKQLATVAEGGLPANPVNAEVLEGGLFKTKQDSLLQRLK
jgi:phosphoglycerate dehydrogenase-like enzyme